MTRRSARQRAGTRCGSGYPRRCGFSREARLIRDRFDQSRRIEEQEYQNLAEYIGAGHTQRLTIHIDC